MAEKEAKSKDFLLIISDHEVIGDKQNAKAVEILWTGCLRTVTAKLFEKSDEKLT